MVCLMLPVASLRQEETASFNVPYNLWLDLFGIRAKLSIILAAQFTLFVIDGFFQDLTSEEQRFSLSSE
jgi:hypothetical protein